jgi:ATP-dependent phosphoenolpyruvate carboxykinase
MAGHPKNIIFLTADAYGCDAADRQARRRRRCITLSGYTAKVAGTEKGLVGVEPNFRPVWRAVPPRRRRNTAICCATISPNIKSTVGW